jgi:hypothetical protein
MDLWPPQLPPDKLAQLQAVAIDWCSANGLVVSKEYPLSVHAPFALFPSPFPKACYEAAVTIQPIFNYLMDKIARDDAFLTQVFVR